jgi:hypothetical protein
LRIQGARGRGNTGQERQSDNGGEDGLHDRSPSFSCLAFASLHCSHRRYGTARGFEQMPSRIRDEQ